MKLVAYCSPGIYWFFILSIPCNAQPSILNNAQSGSLNLSYRLPLPKNSWGRSSRPLKQDELAHLTVEWSPAECQKSFCVISGRVYVKRANRRGEPLDSCQGVRVLIAANCNREVDWSRGYSVTDTVWDECFLDANGRFSGKISFSLLNRMVKKDAKFQVGLVFGVIRDNMISWETSQPALRQSIGFVTIPGRREISEAIRSINSIPSPGSSDYDALVVVQAVNKLRALGKQKVIVELREYIRLANVKGPRHRISDDIATSDQQSLFTLVPLLFPRSLSGVLSAAHDNGNPFGIRVYSGIPFQIQQTGMRSGGQKSPVFLVDWAEEYGLIRDSALTPSANPLKAADQLYKIIKNERRQDNELADALNGGVGLKEDLRWQAWQMICKPGEDRKNRRIDDMLFRSDSDWERFMRQISAKDIVWSEREQNYISRKRIP